MIKVKILVTGISQGIPHLRKKLVDRFFYHILKPGYDQQKEVFVVLPSKDIKFLTRETIKTKPVVFCVQQLCYYRPFWSLLARGLTVVTRFIISIQ